MVAGDTTVWTKGYGPGADPQRWTSWCDRLAVAPDPAEIERQLFDLSRSASHFACVIEAPGWTLAAVDPVRSIPLAHAAPSSTNSPSAIMRIDDRAERLRRTLEVGRDDIDPDAALSFAMAGYTAGDRTLYRQISQLGPGGYLLARAGSPPHVGTYCAYRPWRVTETDGPGLAARLRDLTLSLVEDMIESLDGRPVAAPLSAGLDSRLIVSALRHLGYKKVHCFAYGRMDNYDVAASREIAAALGYDWSFVPLTIGNQRRFLASETVRGYRDFADTLCATPPIDDLSPVATLMDRGVIDADTVLINGNSGDYISGAHVVPAVANLPPDADGATAVSTIVDAALDKHFRLWRALATPENDARVGALLRAALPVDPDTVAPEGRHGLYEALELADRQCKLVIGRQRVYEYLGLDWRLPLWDARYLDFWEGVPLSAKRDQRLYRDVLIEANWGSVWQGRQWWPKRQLIPRWMRLPRAVLKAAHAPLGRERWHRFERRYLEYWKDNLALGAETPYRRVAADRRGARHFVAWHTEAYLRAKGLDYRGRPLPAT